MKLLLPLALLANLSFTANLAHATEAVPSPTTAAPVAVPQDASPGVDESAAAVTPSDSQPITRPMLMDAQPPTDQALTPPPMNGPGSNVPTALAPIEPTVAGPQPLENHGQFDGKISGPIANIPPLRWLQHHRGVPVQNTPTQIAARTMQFELQQSCSARSLRLQPALDRVAADTFETKEKVPGHVPLIAQLSRPDVMADGRTIYYHKLKCISDMVIGKLGEDFKLKRMKDPSDKQAREMRDTLIELRDRLEIQSLNRDVERCKSGRLPLSDQMECVSRLAPAVENGMVFSAINDLLTASETSERTLAEEKDFELDAVRQQIRAARMQDSVRYRVEGHGPQRIMRPAYSSSPSLN